MQGRYLRKEYSRSNVGRGAKSVGQRAGEGKAGKKGVVGKKEERQ